jgi:hypothetical protein
MVHYYCFPCILCVSIQGKELIRYYVSIVYLVLKCHVIDCEERRSTFWSLGYVRFVVSSFFASSLRSSPSGRGREGHFFENRMNESIN